MSIIKSNSANILSAKSEILMSLPRTKEIIQKLDNHHDAAGQELHLYDWILIFTTRDTKIITRLGFVVNFTPKKVTIMSADTWRNVLKKSSINSDHMIKIDESAINYLKALCQ